MNLLVTGGAGFIGSCFIRTVLKKNPDYHVINVDKLTYAGNLENLKDVESNSNYTFVQADICDSAAMQRLFEAKLIDTVINFAAESHVDRSIQDSKAFVQTNVMGTQVLLEMARKFKTSQFLQVSTDEVYGSLGMTGAFKETTNLAPNSPYAASKASADMLVRSYFKTFNLPVKITRCSNNYGPYQYPEKLIPLMTLKAIENKPLPLYGDGLYVRDWIHVEDHVEALLCVLEKGKPGEVYNIGANCEKQNKEIATNILKCLNRPLSLMQSVQDRLGHDRRYAIDSTKIETTLGWKPKLFLDDQLPLLIKWYQENTSWWKKIISKKS